MRRENRRKSIEEGFDTKKMLYITGSVLALAVIAFVITFLLYSSKLNSKTNLSKIDTNTMHNIINKNTQAEETSTSYGKTVNEMQNGVNNTVGNNNQENNQTNQTSTANTQTPKIAVNTSNVEEKNKKQDEEATKSDKTTQKVPDPEFKKPVSGDIMKEFADNKLVYSNTLDVWATHNGIDISSEKTTVVKAAADGKVSSIKNDPRYGLTITIEHVNGYKTVYANLLSTEFVVEGETVKQGQSIGTVGNTASFEISDEPHLHFELLKENEQQDPELYLK